MNAVGAAPSASYMVGDNYTDLASGRQAGMRRVFAAYGFGSPHQEEYDYRIEQFLDLPEIVDR